MKINYITNFQIAGIKLSNFDRFMDQRGYFTETFRSSDFINNELKFFPNGIMQSNESFSHGHALAFTTAVSHEFNNSIFYKRFLKLVKKLNFQPIHLNQNLVDAANLIMTDKKHLDPNPRVVTKNTIIELLEKINAGHALD